MNYPTSELFSSYELRRLITLLRADFPNVSQLTIYKSLCLAASTLPALPTRKTLLNFTREVLKRPGAVSSPSKVA